MKNKINKELEAVLQALGVTRKYIGRSYLIYAVQLVLNDASYMQNIVKALYSEIANTFCTSSSAVERNLRSVAEVVWRHSDQPVFENVFGRRFTYRPTNSELIDCLVYYIECRAEIFERQ